MLLPNGRQTGLLGGGGGGGGGTCWTRGPGDPERRGGGFEKTGPPFEVDHFSRSDLLEFWLNGSRPNSIVPRATDQFISRSIFQHILNVK